MYITVADHSQAQYLFKKTKAILVVFKFNFCPINSVLDIFLKKNNSSQ